MRAALEITDMDLARLWLRQWTPEGPCEMSAPCALVKWDGRVIKARPTGRPIDPAAWLVAPVQAQSLMDGLAALQAAQEGGAGPAVATPEAPTIAALRADYAAATAAYEAVAPEAVCMARLAVCGGCGLWNESDRGGRGRCNYAFCPCSVRLPWLPSEECPKGLWKAAEEALQSSSSGA